MVNKEIQIAKIEVRYASKELVKAAFEVTSYFLKNDKEGIAPVLRQKVLGISSFLSHGTVKSDREEQNEDFLVVMGELREVLKLITIANHLGICPIEHKNFLRTRISNVIDKLDKLVIMLGGFDEKK